ncbi:MAG: magnesium-translocating P-type ATPase [Patescibacteria group bacterium]|nr:magnesium-translocating P-type ATPase [Patescibacteria group bacterium]MDD4610709.1 magnesium-translocating P-type ATPase [Patescibacteria group bacterium]
MPQIKDYSKIESKEICKIFSTSERGLNEREASERLRKYGHNFIGRANQRGAAKIFFSQFANPLVLILLIASLISGFLGDIFSTIVIVAMVLISSLLAFMQEYRSEKTVEALQKRVSLKANVWRNGKMEVINASRLVPGDIVLIDVGKIVPADLRLVKSDDLVINEAALTGESFPVEKFGDGPDGKKKNMAFMGTNVLEGSGKGIVVATGKNTALGQTAKMLEEKELKSEFQKGIAGFGYFLFKIIIFFSLAVFVFLAFYHGQWLEALLFSLAIAVGISPELLPVIITINLSRAASKLSKRHVITKRLMAIENLGNTDVLCTDKTGTLTEGNIVLKKYLDFNGEADDAIIAAAQLCNNYAVTKNISGNVLDNAIIEYAKENKLAKLISEEKIIDDIAFDYERRRMSVIVEKNKKRRLVVKGAAEEVLAVCAEVFLKKKKTPIKSKLENIRKKIEDFEKQGYKVLLIAEKEIENKKNYNKNDEADLVLSGLLLFVDPPKKEAKKIIQSFTDLGVEIKILTGDSENAAKWFCREIGFETGAVISGPKLDKLHNHELINAAKKYKLFAKVTPEHKQQIVKALNASGMAVAFLGDGVNDAPSLKSADVGISVDTAVDVAKEAADIILLKKSLDVIIDGIKEGRRTFGNTLKYIFCTISSNFGNMFSVTGAAIFLPYIPLLPVQVLLLNFLSDMPLLAVSADTVDEEYLKKPKHWDVKKIKKFMAYFGLISSIFDFITFGFLLLVVKASMPLFQTGWFWQSFLTEVLLIFVVRTKRWFYQSRPARALFISTSITLALVLAIIYTPLANIFGFMPLAWPINLTIFGIALVYFAVVEFGKKAFYRKYGI